MYELASLEQELKAAIHNFQVDSEYTDESHLSDYKTHPQPQDTTLFPPIMRASVDGLGWSTEAVSQMADKVLEFGQGSNRPAAVSLRALALFTLGRDEDAVDILHRENFMESAGETALQPEANNSALTALIIQGFTVYGMANERLLTSKNEPGYAPFALAGYARAIDLHETLRGGKKANALRGLPSDEIERWAEVALYRNALLSIRSAEPVQSLNALRSYQAHAGRWIADFRLPQRNVIYRHYLRVLNRSAELGTYADPPETPPKSKDDWRSKAYQLSVVATVASRVQIRDYESERIYRDPSAKRTAPLFSSVRISSRTVSKRRPAAYRDLRPPSSSWSNEVLTAQKMAFISLQKSTVFPHAGHINTAVIDFADEMIKAWRINGEMGGEQADDIVEILYGLVKLTFHSQRISRYLVQLLFAAENPDEAKRALQSYIQIVDKAREAQGTDKQVREVEEEVRTKDQENGDKAPASNASKDAGSDSDDDETFAKTLALGAFYVAKYCQDYVLADKVAEKALTLVEDKTGKPTGALGMNTLLVARLKRVSAFAKAGLAISSADPIQRPVLQSQALALLTTATQLDDQSSEAFYQLAYLQAELRDVHSALQSARKAVDLEPADVEGWHLLVLLLSAQKNYKHAFKVAEAALGECDTDSGAANIFKGVNGDSPANFSPTQLLSVDYPPKPFERSESILRLMLTYNMLEEINDGVENAIAGQKELFVYFHRAFPSAAAAAAAAPDGPNARASQNAGNLERRRSSLAQGGNSNDTVLSRSQTSGGRARSYAQGMGAASIQPRATSGVIGTQFAPSDQEDGTPITSRYRDHLERQSQQLAKVWLASAATFRRAGLLQECRSAIQEAERLQPGLADVWVQLSLYFMDGSQSRLAVDSLYKALACSSHDVAASVHLAKLFLADPQLKPQHDQQAPSPDLKNSHNSTGDVGGESRTISTAAPETTSTLGSPATHKFSTVAEATMSAKAQDLSAVSLAEGLLTTTTKGAGWDASEAWLFLGKAVQRCNRPQRARECFEYALQLENTKPIRPLANAVLR